MGREWSASRGGMGWGQKTSTTVTTTGVCRAGRQSTLVPSIASSSRYEEAERNAGFDSVGCSFGIYFEEVDFRFLFLFRDNFLEEDRLVAEPDRVVRERARTDERVFDEFEESRRWINCSRSMTENNKLVANAFRIDRFSAAFCASLAFRLFLSTSLMFSIRWPGISRWRMSL